MWYLLPSFVVVVDLFFCFTPHRYWVHQLYVSFTNIKKYKKIMAMSAYRTAKLNLITFCILYIVRFKITQIYQCALHSRESLSPTHSF